MAYDDEWKDPFEEEEEVLPPPPAVIERRRRHKRQAQPLVPWWVWASGGLVLVLAIALLWTWALKAMNENREAPTVAFTPTFTRPPSTATVPPTDTPLPAPPTDTPVLPTPTVGDQIGVGGWVKVIGAGDAGLSLRAGPGLENVRLKILIDGTVLKVLDGPREDQGYTWWRLEEYTASQPGVIGWAIDDFLEPTSPPQ